jgi:hypothetical protein
VPTTAPLGGPAATATPSTTPLSVTGVPPCLHDPTKWHGLVEYNPDGSIRCTYDHEHGDNPHALDAVFGPPIQEVDYPWHAYNTRNGATENHRLFKWAVITDAKCTTRFGQLSFDKLRLQYHAGSSAASMRVHSYSLEAETCDPNDPTYHGQISMGGWLDFGQLAVYSHVGQSTPTNVPISDQDFWGPYSNTALHRLHSSGSTPIYPNLTWYGANGIVKDPNGLRFDCNVGVVREVWGGVDTTNPTGNPLLWGPPYNGSWQEPAHLIGFVVQTWSPGVANGYANLTGYLDRWGNLSTTCSGVGAECVPIKLTHVKVGSYQWRADDHGIANRDYDTKLNGQSLIEYSN